MIRRVWNPSSRLAADRKVVRYDFGDYEGWLEDGGWKCWRIISTEKVGESIQQTLLEMPVDYCPFKAYGIEEVNPFSGWDLQEVRLSGQPEQRRPLQQRPPQQPREISKGSTPGHSMRHRGKSGS